MSFDAIDKFKLPFGGALQQSPSRPARNPVAQVGDTSLPKLRGSTEGIKTGPDRDVFQKSAALPKSTVEKPAAASANSAAPKPDASSWMQFLKNGLSAKLQSLRVEKLQSPNFTGVNDSAKKLSGAEAMKPLDRANRTMAETLAPQASKPNANLFANSKVNTVKKPVEQSGLASALMSVASLGSLVSFVAGPAALVAKPALIKSITATLPTQLP